MNKYNKNNNWDDEDNEDYIPKSQQEDEILRQQQDESYIRNKDDKLNHRRKQRNKRVVK